MKQTKPTREFSESRHLHSPIINQARERLASQGRIITVKRYDWWLKKEVEEQRFDFKHMETLVEQEYIRLRGLYSIPFIFEDFQNHVYRHPVIYPWAIHGHFAAIYNTRVYGSKRRKRHLWDRWGDSTGVYYRKGPGYTHNGTPKKVEPVSDQYQVNAEVARKDWRENKQFKRDKSKNRSWCKCGRYGKNVDHRGRRAYERKMIANERWDEITDHKDMFYDSWDAC